VAQEGDSSRFFVETMDRHGLWIMLVELAVIAVCTFAAIASDGFWSRRAKARRAESPDLSAAASSGEERPAASAGPQTE
jgi:hypothetical protein